VTLGIRRRSAGGATFHLMFWACAARRPKRRRWPAARANRAGTAATSAGWIAFRTRAPPRRGEACEAGLAGPAAPGAASTPEHEEPRRALAPGGFVRYVTSQLRLRSARRRVEIRCDGSFPAPCRLHVGLRVGPGEVFVSAPTPARCPRPPVGGEGSWLSVARSSAGRTGVRRAKRRLPCRAVFRAPVSCEAVLHERARAVPSCPRGFVCRPGGSPAASSP
jgi:hypothetical protein